MAAKHASVKLSTEFLADARKEAEAFNRSLGAQVEHWARLGRAFENTPGIGIDRVREALAGRLKFEDLTTVEQDAFLEQFGIDFGPEVDAAYAEIGNRPGAVGRDEAGRLVKRAPDGRLIPID
jgi:hypothetical protein